MEGMGGGVEKEEERGRKGKRTTRPISHAEGTYRGTASGLGFSKQRVVVVLYSQSYLHGVLLREQQQQQQPAYEVRPNCASTNQFGIHPPGSISVSTGGPKAHFCMYVFRSMRQSGLIGT